MSQNYNCEYEERMIAASELCQKLHDAFAAIANGDSFPKACGRIGLNAERCRRLLSSRTFQLCEEPTIPLEKALTPIIDPYAKFYKCVFPDFDSRKMQLPFDYEDSVEFVLQQLDEQKFNMVRMYCGIDEENGQGKTIEEIGKIYNMTRERIRKQINQTFRELKTLQNMQILKKGLCQYQKDEEVKKVYVETKKQKLKQKKIN